MENGVQIGLTQSEHGGSSNTPGSSFDHDDDDVAIGNNSNNEVLCDEHFSDVRETSLVINSPSITRRRRYGTSLDVEEVKILTSRLNLVTRRPSVNVWMQQHFVGGAPIAPAQWVEMTSRFSSDDVTHDIDAIWSPDFRNRINASLDWLRNELISMREQDAILARHFLNIRKNIFKLKLERSTEKHRMILDEARYIEEERDELQQSTDCDNTPEPFSPTLKHCGVTRMNIHSRRFSVF